jgi:hypothetical protein
MRLGVSCTEGQFPDRIGDGCPGEQIEGCRKNAQGRERSGGNHVRRGTESGSDLFRGSPTAENMVSFGR